MHVCVHVWGCWVLFSAVIPTLAEVWSHGCGLASERAHKDMLVTCYKTCKHRINSWITFSGLWKQTLGFFFSSLLGKIMRIWNTKPVPKSILNFLNCLEIVPSLWRILSPQISCPGHQPSFRKEHGSYFPLWTSHQQQSERPVWPSWEKMVIQPLPTTILAFTFPPAQGIVGKHSQKSSV